MKAQVIGIIIILFSIVGCQKYAIIKIENKEYFYDIGYVVFDSLEDTIPKPNTKLKYFIPVKKGYKYGTRDITQSKLKDAYIIFDPQKYLSINKFKSHYDTLWVNKRCIDGNCKKQKRCIIYFPVEIIYEKYSPVFPKHEVSLFYDNTKIHFKTNQEKIMIEEASLLKLKQQI